MKIYTVAHHCCFHHRCTNKLQLWLKPHSDSRHFEIRTPLEHIALHQVVPSTVKTAKDLPQRSSYSEMSSYYVRCRNEGVAEDRER